MVTVQAAVVQDAPVAFDLDATLGKVDRLAAEAAAGGTELVVFPEAFVSAYPRGVTFGATVGQRTPEGRQRCTGGTGSPRSRCPARPPSASGPPPRGTGSTWSSASSNAIAARSTAPR
ncbi:nitrilase-related carbon-nitrogen hydrolase [Saccharopolyspora oryzae]|uniref:nitrilase-related carbon-nitrogen hydrolase n=1 Tax=Saccharopolyspora oryzae TaxID=2997343 RepID=UPI002FDBDD56